jgi:DnaK suppressor protein
VPAKKTATASSKRSASRAGSRSGSARGGGRKTKTSAGLGGGRKTTTSAGRGAGRKTTTSKTGAKPDVKKATKTAGRKSAASRTTKTSAKKPSPRKPASVAKRSAAKTAVAPAKRKSAPRVAAKRASAARPAAEAPKKTPRLAPHRREEAAPQVAAGEVQGLRDKLLAEREQVTRLYENDMRMSLLPDEDVTDDLVDRANNAYSRELHFAISDSERERLGLIDQALERMEQGSFGICLSCRRPVPAARLQAVPWARYCTDCQELAEKGLLREP